jgi:hypothetical protein
MSDFWKRVIAAGLGASLLATVEAAGLVGAGDRNVVISAYDPGLQTVTVGKQTLRLTAPAAQSLWRQLSDLRIPKGKPFGARLMVADNVGGLLIEAIHVYPPPKR